MKLKVLSAVWVLAVVLVLVAVPASATAPEVTHTSIADGAKGVLVTVTSITIKFSTGMDEDETISAISMTPNDVTRIECVQSLIECQSFDMTVSLQEGVHYIVIVSTDAEDIAGNNLANDYLFSFTTESAPPSSSSDQLTSFLTTYWAWILLFIVIIIILIAVYYRRR